MDKFKLCSGSVYGKSCYDKGVNNMCYSIQIVIYHARNNVYHDKLYFNNYTDAKERFDKLSDHLHAQQERHEIETWYMCISPYKGF